MRYPSWIALLAVVIGVCLAFSPVHASASEDGAVAGRERASSGSGDRPAAAEAVDALEQPAEAETEPGESEKKKVYTRQIPEAELIRDLGVTKGEPIDSGFVFLDGQYLDAPYIVTRKGLSVYLNDREVYRVFLPKKEPPSGEVDPKLPPQITRDTSINDEMFRKHWQQKVAYVQKHHSSEEEARIIEKWFRNLPFIKEARPHPKHEGYLNVTTYGGETASVALVVPRRKGRFDRQTILERAEGKRQGFEDKLRAGSCLVLFSNGGRLGVRLEKLPRVVEILRSAVSAEEKFKALQGLGLPVRPDSFSEVVTNFSASSQLEKRLKEAFSEDKSEPAE